MDVYRVLPPVNVVLRKTRGLVGDTLANLPKLDRPYLHRTHILSEIAPLVST